MVISSRPTPQFSAFHAAAGQRRRWRIAASTHRRIADFIVMMLRRPRRRRAFGPATTGAGAWPAPACPQWRPFRDGSAPMDPAGPARRTAGRRPTLGL